MRLFRRLHEQASVHISQESWFGFFNCPIQTDNSVAEAVANSNVVPRFLKVMDQRLWWLRDREANEQFRFFWRPGKHNLGDYFTKHHPPIHHVNMRKEFLTPGAYLENLRRRKEKANRAVQIAQAIYGSFSPATRVC